MNPLDKILFQLILWMKHQIWTIMYMSHPPKPLSQDLYIIWSLLPMKIWHCLNQIKEGIVGIWEEVCEGVFNFPSLLLSKFLITIHLIFHLRLHLSFMFALNFATTYLFEFLVLIEVVRIDVKTKIYPHVHKY